MFRRLTLCSGLLFVAIAGVQGCSCGSAATEDCFDLDGDGVTGCDGDCDDDNDLTFPGATEVCGDGLDNSCDGESDPDALCMGLGTFVSALTGDDVNGDGTQLNPLATISAGVRNATTIGGGVDVFIGEGDYMENVTVSEGIDFLGGFHCTATECDWARDPKSFKSQILNLDDDGIYAGAGVTSETRIDGLTVVSHSGTPGDGNFIAAITIDTGALTVTNNEIYGGTVSGCGNCSSEGVIVFGPQTDPAGALISGNLIEAGDSASGSSGVSLRTFGSPALATISDNTINGGAGVYTRAINAFGAAAGSRIVGNTVNAGTQTGSNQGSSFAMVLSGGALTVDGNRVNTSATRVGSCTSPSFWCGGIESEGATATLTNNIVFGMDAPMSTAVYMGEGEVPFGELVVNSNTLDGGGLVNRNGVSISAAISCRTTQGTNAVVGRIRNNILAGGRAVNRFGMYEEDQTMGRTCEPAALENNGVYFKAQVNTIDNAYRQWTAQGVEVLLPSVNDVNTQRYASANFTGDPMLDASSHIQAGSACIDRGVATEAPAADIDGDPRPLGAAVDVGADELE